MICRPSSATGGSAGASPLPEFDDEPDPPDFEPGAAAAPFDGAPAAEPDAAALDPESASEFSPCDAAAALDAAPAATVPAA